MEGKAHPRRPCSTLEGPQEGRQPAAAAASARSKAIARSQCKQRGGSTRSSVVPFELADKIGAGQNVFSGSSEFN